MKTIGRGKVKSLAGSQCPSVIARVCEGPSYKLKQPRVFARDLTGFGGAFGSRRAFSFGGKRALTCKVVPARGLFPVFPGAGELGHRGGVVAGIANGLPEVRCLIPRVLPLQH